MSRAGRGVISSDDVATIPAIPASSVNQFGNFLYPGTGAVTRTLLDRLSEVLSVKDFGATGDGLTDNTAAFRAAVAAAPVGGVIYVPPTDSFYKINTGGATTADYGIPLTKSVTFEGAGYASYIKATFTGAKLFGANGIVSPNAHHITFRNLRLEHTGLTSINDGCIFFQNTNDLLVENVDFTAGVVAIDARKVARLDVIRNRFIGITRQNLAVCDNGLANTPSNTVRILGNTFTGGLYAALGAAQAPHYIEARDTNDLTIGWNTFEDTDGFNAYGYGATSIVVQSLKGHPVYGTKILFNDLTKTTQGTYSGIQVYGSAGATDAFIGLQIIGNWIRNYYTGIELQPIYGDNQYQSAEIAQNHIFNSAYNGIAILTQGNPADARPQDINVHDNKILGPGNLAGGDSGIRVWGINRCLFFNNTSMYNKTNGMHLSGNNNTISGNRFKNNLMYGLNHALQGGTTWTTANNKIVNNDVGDDQAVPTQVYGIVSITTGVGSVITGNYGSGNTTGLLSYTLKQGDVVERNPGYNPFGVVASPGFPATNTPLVNPFPFAVRIYITGGTVTVIKIGATTTGLVPPCSIELGVGESVTFAHTGAASWTWFGR